MRPPSVQGPFPAQDMLSWHEAGYLHDMSLLMCGTVSRGAGVPSIAVRKDGPVCRQSRSWRLALARPGLSVASASAYIARDGLPASRLPPPTQSRWFSRARRCVQSPTLPLPLTLPGRLAKRRSARCRRPTCPPRISSCPWASCWKLPGGASALWRSRCRTSSAVGGALVARVCSSCCCPSRDCTWGGKGGLSLAGGVGSEGLWCNVGADAKYGFLAPLRLQASCHRTSSS